MDRVGQPRWGAGGKAVKPEEYSRRQQELIGWPIAIESYKLGDVYHCTIANVDPGARIARAEGSTRVEAEQRALEKAERYLAQTRRFTSS
jgi:hypothetical protein